MGRRIRLGVLGTAVALLALVLPVGAAQAQPVDTVAVSANDQDGVDSASLTAGVTYVFEASGVASYGFQNGQFDVECSTAAPIDPTWQRARFLLLDPESDMLDVLVNNENVEWEATTADTFGCNSSTHRYTFTFTPEVSGPVNLRVHDIEYRDNHGGFAIEIHEAAETFLETLIVPAAASGGASGSISLDPTRFYRIEASGSGTYDGFGSRFDAECSNLLPDNPVWLPNTYLLLDAQEDLLDLYLNGQNVSWRSGEPLPCDTTEHSYDVIFQPRSAGPLNALLFDRFHGDNSGELEVNIYRLEFTPDLASGPIGQPEVSLTEQIEVDSADPDGTTSAIPFRAGDQYLIESSGTFAYGVGNADTRCSTTPTNPTFAPSEESYPSFPPGTLQLVLNGVAQDWAPTEPDTLEPNCNSTNHTYRLVYMPAVSGLVNFRILDGFYGDNGGVLNVKVFRIREIPMGRVMVNSASPSGTFTPPLIAGREYRFRSTGTYDYFQGATAANADAECSQAGFPPFDSPTYERHRWGTGNDDLLDIFFNAAGVEWKTAGGSSTGCDAVDHAYDHQLEAGASGPIALNIRDNNYGDNAGSLPVDIFLQAS